MRKQMIHGLCVNLESLCGAIAEVSCLFLRFIICCIVKSWSWRIGLALIGDEVRNVANHFQRDNVVQVVLWPLDWTAWRNHDWAGVVGGRPPHSPANLAPFSHRLYGRRRWDNKSVKLAIDISTIE